MPAALPVTVERSTPFATWQFALGGAAIAPRRVRCCSTQSGYADHRGDALTRNTVRLSLAWYAAALCLMMRLQAPTDWAAQHAAWPRGPLVLDVGGHRLSGPSRDGVPLLPRLVARPRLRDDASSGAASPKGIFVSYFFTLWWACRCGLAGGSAPVVVCAAAERGSGARFTCSCCSSSSTAWSSSRVGPDPLGRRRAVPHPLPSSGCRLDDPAWNSPHDRVRSRPTFPLQWPSQRPRRVDSLLLWLGQRLRRRSDDARHDAGTNARTWVDHRANARRPEA
jgi:hypothetical protein